jgi:hypothetical protein
LIQTRFLRHFSEEEEEVVLEDSVVKILEVLVFLQIWEEWVEIKVEQSLHLDLDDIFNYLFKEIMRT